jgi:hypothetical protein
MAKIHGVVLVVGLELKHANAIIQLGCYWILLIGSEIALSVKGAVMSGHICDVGVAAIAKLDIAVARLGVCGRRDGRSGCT